MSRLSPETRAKISASRMGQRLTQETKDKIRATKARNDSVPKGESHYKWKGGKPWQRFKDPRYIAWRTAVLERDDYVCQICGRKCMKHEKGLAAHHIKPYAEFPELRYELSNGETLCRYCHLTIHGNAPEPKASIFCACGCGMMIAPFDPYGRPRQYINGHARRGAAQTEETKEKLRQQRQGKPLSPEHRAQIAVGLRKSDKRIGRPPRCRPTP
jgi:hypothetical protein